MISSRATSKKTNVQNVHLVDSDTEQDTERRQETELLNSPRKRKLWVEDIGADFASWKEFKVHRNTMTIV